MQRLSLVFSLIVVLASALLITGVSSVVRGGRNNHHKKKRRQLKDNNAPTPAAGGGKNVPGAPTAPVAAPTKGGAGTPKAGDQPVAPYPYEFHNLKKNLTCPNAFSVRFQSVVQQDYKTRYCTNNTQCSDFPTMDGIPCCLWPYCICGANTPEAPTVSCVTPLNQFLGG